MGELFDEISYLQTRLRMAQFTALGGAVQINSNSLQMKESELLAVSSQDALKLEVMLKLTLEMPHMLKETHSNSWGSGCVDTRLYERVYEYRAKKWLAELRLRDVSILDSNKCSSSEDLASLLSSCHKCLAPDLRLEVIILSGSGHI